MEASGTISRFGGDVRNLAHRASLICSMAAKSCTDQSSIGELDGKVLANGHTDSTLTKMTSAVEQCDADSKQRKVAVVIRLPQTLMFSIVS